MGKAKELTDRDRELLLLLARCRVLEIGQVARMFGVRDYHRTRVSVLAKRGYLLRRAGFVKLGQKGLRAIGLDGGAIPVRGGKQRRKLTQFVEIYLALRNKWDFAFSREYKKHSPAVSFARFGAVISRNGAEYLVYLVLTKAREPGILKLRQEIAGMPRYNIHRAVVFYAHPETRTLFDGDIPELESLLLLPYPVGLSVLSRLDEIHDHTRAHFPGCTPCSRPFADYEHEGVYVSVLADNDLAKIKRLREYLEHVQRLEGRACVGVCLPGQEEYLAGALPGLKLVVLLDVGVSGDDRA